MKLGADLDDTIRCCHIGSSREKTLYEVQNGFRTEVLFVMSDTNRQIGIIRIEKRTNSARNKVIYMLR
jgi:hypothetical protein